MKIIKIIVLVIWVLCTTIFVIGVLTPLEFTHKAILYATFVIAFNGIMILGYLLTNFIRIKIQRVLTGLIATIVLILTFEFYPTEGTGWKTKDILYRQKDDKDNVIAYQVNDMGYAKDHRTVKITQVTPLFTLVKELQKIEVSNNWIKEEEAANQ